MHLRPAAHHRSGPPYHAESEGLNHQTEVISPFYQHCYPPRVSTPCLIFISLTPRVIPLCAQDPGGGALPPFPGPHVNGGFAQSSASNGGCHKEGPRLFGASSSASMATTDVTGVQTWILEAGTPAGQLARAQRALQDMAAERDGAVYRHREVRRSERTRPLSPIRATEPASTCLPLPCRLSARTTCLGNDWRSSAS